MRLEWDEMPFQYEAPYWFITERRFTMGPAKGVKAHLMLTPHDEGTRIDYSVELEPRNVLFHPLIYIDAHLSLKASLGGALRAAIAHLDDASAIYDAPAEPLDPAARQRLDEGLASVEPPLLRDALRTLVCEGPLYRQNRIAPLAIGQRLGLDDATVLAGFLEASRAGALSLVWEILCPYCKVPKGELEMLSLATDQVHCDTCNIRYDASFPDAVNVSFKPAPAVRQVDLPMDCLLSPQHTPHVIAQLEVPACDAGQLTLRLEPGAYLVRTDADQEAATIEVSERFLERSMSIDMNPHGLAPTLLRSGPGTVTLHLRSRLDRSVQLRVERRGLPPWTLTAGRLLEHPQATALLPAEALRAGLELVVERQAALAVEWLAESVEANARVTAILKGREPRVLTQANSTLVAAWDDFESALEAAEALDGDPRYSVGLNVGPVGTLREDGVLRPTGQTIETLVETSRNVGSGRTALADPEESEVVATLARWGARLRVDQRGVIAFRSTRERRREVCLGRRRIHEPPPAEVGGWQVGAPLAEGGFGRVFAATSTAGVDAAIKLMHTHIADDPVHAQRFYSEARIASGLTHPNTVRVFDWGHASNGHLFLVMERLHGHELQDEIDSCDYIDPVRGAQIAIQALGALAEAHEFGVVHLDVKPSNLFVCDDDHIKVIDFGIARKMDPDDDAEPLDEMLGTPDYLSPEQARCRPIDGRSDIYAVGLVLYRCVAGQLPFVGGDLMDIAMQRVLSPARPIQEVSRQPLPPELSKTIMRALATKPANRWQTAMDMSEALSTMVEAMSVGAVAVGVGSDQGG